MVQVWVVRMRVDQRLVAVAMDMRLAAIPGGIVRVPVVRIVHVLVFVLQRLMRVLVRVALREVQPHAERHQSSGEPESRIRAFPR